MPLPIRYSPSGAIIATLGSGARLRLTELCSAISGSASIPTAKSIINSDGFAGSAALILTLDNPKPDLKYRAELRLDVWNVTTSTGGQVVLFIETSVDGINFTSGVAQNAHIVQAQLGDSSDENGQLRECTLNLPLTLGSDLGVVAGSPSLKVRFLAQTVVGDASTLQVNSQATSSGSAAVPNLNGTIHAVLEESLGS